MNRKRILRTIASLGAMFVLTFTTASAYSTTNAISYANMYALSPNTSYSSYFADCTNYVSQCLHAGGLAQDNTWYSINYGTYRSDSTAWINANALKNYLRDSGKSTKLGSWSKNGTTSPFTTYAYVNNSANLTSTNAGKVVVFYDWETDNIMDHASFFVANNAQSTFSSEGRGDLINQHSNNRKQVLWHLDARNDDRLTTKVYAFELNT